MHHVPPGPDGEFDRRNRRSAHPEGLSVNEVEATNTHQVEETPGDQGTLPPSELGDIWGPARPASKPRGTPWRPQEDGTLSTIWGPEIEPEEPARDADGQDVDIWAPPRPVGETARTAVEEELDGASPPQKSDDPQGQRPDSHFSLPRSWVASHRKKGSWGRRLRATGASPGPAVTPPPP